MKVRSKAPPSTGEFDDKGNPKKPSNAELNKMKGDTTEERRLPGYKIDLSSVRIGDVIKVSIGKPKASTTNSAKVSYTHVGDIVGTVSKVSGSQVTIQIPNCPTPGLNDKLVATMIIVEKSSPNNNGTSTASKGK